MQEFNLTNEFSRITSYNVCYTKLLRGDLVEEVNQVTDAEIDSLMNDYKKLYSIAEHDDQDFASYNFV